MKGPAVGTHKSGLNAGKGGEESLDDLGKERRQMEDLAPSTTPPAGHVTMDQRDSHV